MDPDYAAMIADLFEDIRIDAEVAAQCPPKSSFEERLRSILESASQIQTLLLKMP